VPCFPLAAVAAVQTAAPGVGGPPAARGSLKTPPHRRSAPAEVSKRRPCKPKYWTVPRRRSGAPRQPSESTHTIVRQEKPRASRGLTRSRFARLPEGLQALVSQAPGVRVRAAVVGPSLTIPSNCRFAASTGTALMRFSSSRIATSRTLLPVKPETTSHAALSPRPESAAYSVKSSLGLAPRCLHGQRR
jgi:hypothetical protein